MFRRFMIVCWLIFGLSVAITAYLWNEADGHQKTVMMYFDAIDNHPAMALELPDPRYESIEDKDGHTVSTLLRLQGRAAENRDRVRDGAGSVIRLAMFALLWIIICYIGRWVWLGREKA